MKKEVGVRRNLLKVSELLCFTFLNGSKIWTHANLLDVYWKPTAFTFSLFEFFWGRGTITVLTDFSMNFRSFHVGWKLIDVFDFTTLLIDGVFVEAVPGGNIELFEWCCKIEVA